MFRPLTGPLRWMLPKQCRESEMSMFRTPLAIAAMMLAGALAVPALAQDAPAPDPAPAAKPKPKPPARKKPVAKKSVAKPAAAATGAAAAGAVAAPEPAKPAEAAQSGGVWGGDWTLSSDGKTYAVNLADASSGVVGGAITGSLKVDDKSCVMSGLWYRGIAGAYPDGGEVKFTEMNGIVRWRANCPDGGVLSGDMFFIPEGKGASGAAGRLQWVDGQGKLVLMKPATLQR